MEYKLYNEPSYELSPLRQILFNRGIPVEEHEHWLNAGWDDINDWSLLGKQDMQDACSLVYKHIKDSIVIIVDPDTDGFMSSAILVNYLNDIAGKNEIKSNIHYVMHTGKQHGMSDIMDDILECKPSLVISADGGSNDIEQHKRFHYKGIDCLVLDHHEVSIDIKESPALIINVQTCGYPNKSLTGGGVVWQFCRAFDNLFGYDFANEYIDLAAIANIGDMADYRKIETRALVNCGLENIKNKFVKAMIEKNSYSIDKMNGVNYYSLAFYLVPYLNGLCRSGTMFEKKMVFSSLLNEYKDMEVESTKRGAFDTLVPLVEEAILVADRVKRRQTKLQDEAMELLDKKIEDENLLNNAILLLLLEPGDIEPELAGLVANKEQSKYQKPCAILTRTMEDGEEAYIGSMRNYSLSEKQNLKKELEDTGQISWCAGHNSAAGLSIPAKNIDSFLEAFNSQYANVKQTPIYWVDYSWKPNTIDPKSILDISDLNIYGQGIQESYVAIDELCIKPQTVTLMSPDKHPTLKISLPNGVSIIKFKSSQEEYEKFCEDGLVLKCVCKCAKNEWDGKVTPQLLVQDYELYENWVF